MPFRTKNTYSTSRGTVNTRKHTFEGKGPAPAGTKKVKEKTYKEVPTVTTSPGPTGTVRTTSGFPSPAAAKAAVKRSKASQKRVRKIAAQARVKRASAIASLSKKGPGVARRMTTKTVISSTPGLDTTPSRFRGHKTVGEPTLHELQKAVGAEKLGTNERGLVTTPHIRQVLKHLHRAETAVARSNPSVAGLSPAERAVLPLALKAHRKYPDIPVSVLMAQDKQESGFNPAAISSAGAQGLSQFIPSTASSYGVQYGTGRREQQSQVTGQAHLLHDDNFATDPQGALSAYSGGYAAGDYNNPILVDAEASYAGLDKPGNPKALRRLKGARQAAKAVGLKPKGGVKGKPQVNALKVFGKQVARELKLVEAGKYESGPGKLVVGESDISYGHEPEIAARLKLLSAKIGKPIYIISGHRTPQHSVEVGGFADDPHTEGKASDIGVGSALRDSAGTVSEALYESVGLHRPYYPESSAEINHVELLNGGTPATGTGVPSAPTGLAPSVGGGGVLPSGAVSSFAAQTGQTPKQVKNKLKRGKLTPQQILNKLTAVGAGVGERRKAKEPETHPVLQEMIEKYGSGGTGVPTEAAQLKERLAQARQLAKR